LAVLVYEHAVATGDRRLLPEGSAMAEALAMALSEAGETPLIPAAEGVGLRWGVVVRSLEEALDMCDGAVVVAPEDDDVLAGVIEELSEAGLRVYGPDPDAARLAADKVETKSRLEKAGLRVPPEDGECLVVKPRDSCGSEGVIMSLDDGVNDGDVLIEGLVAGPKCSVLACRWGDDIGILAVNDQVMVEAAGHMIYVGGVTPSAFLDVDDVRSLAVTVGDALGLDGVFGVDLVVTKSGPVVLEVNPRPTTPIVAAASEDPESVASSLLGDPRDVSYGSSYLYVHERLSMLTEMIMDRMEVEASEILKIGGLRVVEIR